MAEREITSAHVGWFVKCGGDTFRGKGRATGQIVSVGDKKIGVKLKGHKQPQAVDRDDCQLWVSKNVELGLMAAPAHCKPQPTAKIVEHVEGDPVVKEPAERLKAEVDVEAAERAVSVARQRRQAAISRLDKVRMALHSAVDEFGGPGT